MNIKEAAEYLGISVKTLERRPSFRRYFCRLRAGATGKQRTLTAPNSTAQASRG
jgi:hypothetical protein